MRLLNSAYNNSSLTQYFVNAAAKVLHLYRPPNQCSKFFFNEVEKGLEFYCSKYEKIILIGDLNCEPSDSVIRDFMNSYNFTNMVRDPTCFKSNNQTCIDLILTNGKGSLKSTTTAETGLSDSHVMILTAIRGGFVKRCPRIKNISGLLILQT